MITNDKITINNAVLKGDDNDRKDNIPSNVKEYGSKITENAILQKNEEIPFQIVTKNDETDEKPKIENKDNFRSYFNGG